MNWKEQIGWWVRRGALVGCLLALVCAALNPSAITVVDRWSTWGGRFWDALPSLMFLLGVFFGPLVGAVLGVVLGLWRDGFGRPEIEKRPSDCGSQSPTEPERSN
jgi:hypothetical protein